MNPWIIIGLFVAGVVFLLDYLMRRKKWNQNTKQEKISLLLNMFSVAIYAFASILGLLWGITGSGAETAVGEVIYNITLVMCELIGVIALAATIASLILRKKNKIKASIMVNIFALIYIVVVLGINSLTGLI